MLRKWKEIPNFEGYWLSDDGLIKKNDRLMALGKSVSGWPIIAFIKDKKRVTRAICPMVLELFDRDHRMVDVPHTFIPYKDQQIMEGKDWDEIRKSFWFESCEGKIPYYELARIYEVSAMMIYFIKHGQNWPTLWKEHH